MNLDGTGNFAMEDEWGGAWKGRQFGLLYFVNMDLESFSLPQTCFGRERVTHFAYGMYARRDTLASPRIEALAYCTTLYTVS